jgi:large subunit ribosomal protein L16
MLTPKRIIHKKVFNKYGQKRRGSLNRGATLINGEFGLKAMGSSWLTSRQIESARRVISRRCKGGKVFIRVFPARPVTQKALNVPMGTGVGSIEYFMFPVKPGRIIFEVRGVPEEKVKEAFRIAGHKLPFATKMVSQHDLFA